MGRGFGGVVTRGFDDVVGVEVGALVRVGVGFGGRGGVLVVRRGDGVADEVGVSVVTGSDGALRVGSAAVVRVCAARAPTIRGLVTASAPSSTATAAVAPTTRGQSRPLRGAA
ncbi:MAG: hypothetical protein ACRCY8_02525 [Dermatophilaceae bacterium]